MTDIARRKNQLLYTLHLKGVLGTSTLHAYKVVQEWLRSTDRLTSLSQILTSGDKQIKGLKFYDMDVKIYLYVDDTTIFLEPN